MTIDKLMSLATAAFIAPGFNNLHAAKATTSAVP